MQKNEACDGTFSTNLERNRAGGFGQGTYQTIETSVAFDVEEPPDRVAVHVRGNATHVAATESEGDKTIRVEFVPRFFLGEIREALVDSAVEDAWKTPSGALWLVLARREHNGDLVYATYACIRVIGIEEPNAPTVLSRNGGGAI